MGKHRGFRVECLLFKQPPYRVFRSKLSQTICEQCLPSLRSDGVCRRCSPVTPMSRRKPFLGLERNAISFAAGGSSPLGSVGYVKAVLELKSQIEADILPEPRFIFVPVGTCGTIAGLIVGVRLAGLRSSDRRRPCR